MTGLGSIVIEAILLAALSMSVTGFGNIIEFNFPLIMNIIF